MAPPTESNRRSGKGRYQKTLGSLLRHFIDMHLTVELKNGKMYRGILAQADESMSLVLDEAIDVSTMGVSRHTKNQNIHQTQGSDYFSSMHIRGPMIRYIHFPNTNLATTIKQGREREREAADKYQRGVRKVRSSTT